MPLTLGELISAYTAHCTNRFRKYGRATSTASVVRCATNLLAAAGLDALRVEQFGPRALLAWRDWLCAEPSRRWSRRTISTYVRHVVQMIRWAASQELLPQSQYASLLTIEPLRRGQSCHSTGATLRDGAKVRPVGSVTFEAIVSAASPMLADMIRLQALTAMRPCELVSIRWCDIRPGPAEGTLMYVVPPQVNKTDHKDRERVVIIGPKGVEILTRWATPGNTGFVFSPRRSEISRRAVMRSGRKTKMWDSHSNSVRAQRRRNTGVKRERLGESYTTDSYRRAIERLCNRLGIPAIAPNRLRHTGATVIAASSEVSVAQLLLGHADISTTMRYVETDVAKAASVIRRIG